MNALPVSVIWISIIRICFGFRISSFGFVSLLRGPTLSTGPTLSAGPTPRATLGRSIAICNSASFSLHRRPAEMHEFRSDWISRPDITTLEYYRHDPRLPDQSALFVSFQGCRLQGFVPSTHPFVPFEHCKYLGARRTLERSRIAAN